MRQPDQIGFGAPSSGGSVGTFTVELIHRLKTPPELKGKVFPVGDSLSTVDPYTGTGMSKAVFEGVSAARLVAYLLQYPNQGNI